MDENQGEGNKTAAREYNEAQRRFAESGKVEAAARVAERSLEGPERRELVEAEATGKSRAAPDPETNVHAISVRAYEIWERDGRPEGRHDEHWHQARRELAAKAKG